MILWNPDDYSHDEESFMDWCERMSQASIAADKVRGYAITDLGHTAEQNFCIDPDHHHICHRKTVSA